MAQASNGADEEAAPKADKKEQQQQSLATAQSTFDRLSAANAKLATAEDHGKFWTRDDVRAAANGLPFELKQKLAAEKNAKAEELTRTDPQTGEIDDGDIPFPGDLPMEREPA
jgi:hypothetical protein